MSTMTINGQSKPLPDDADALLVDVIRDQLALTGTKLVCGSGVCGACTVLLEGTPVASCLLPAQAAAGKALTTVEGVGGTNLHPIQKAFMAHDALQALGPRSQPATALRLGRKPRRLAQPQARHRAKRPISTRRRRCRRILVLFLATWVQHRTRHQGRPHCCKHRRAGYRHRHAQRDRRYGREGV